MSTEDITRNSFDPLKHYTGTRMQAGRVVTDFDWNDKEQITTEERRRTRLDVIGAYGSPDTGFRVENVRVENGMVEFDILPGTLYVGGLRLALEALETYRTQRDLLQLTEIPNPANSPNRRDLVFLEAFEAPVSAVEDGELLDPALGGVDTAQRMRRFQRVRVVPNADARDCDEAWTLLQELLAEAWGGAVGEEYYHQVDTTLTVTYTTEGIDDDLCEPPFAGGYLGAENQAIRVQLVDRTHLTWGFDNAAPLYRVTLSADRQKLTMLNVPRDDYSMPRNGQTVEILPWNALLPNGEKTAGISGHLTRIGVVDPADETANGAITITLDSAVPTSGFDDWQNRDDAGLMEEEGIFYFLRVWNRGADSGSDPAVEFTVGDPVTLGTTGIQVTINGADAAQGDYWVIAARPETPTRALPWGLENGQPPDGVRRYYAPLAIIHWRTNGTVNVLDCRPPFRPLTRLQGCCTYTVGDGVTSDGDFNDIDEALSRLPPIGGEICLLPGLHRANVLLEGLTNVSISGCGVRSKLIPANPDDGTVIRVRESTGIGLYNFDVVTADGTGIEADTVQGLRIEDLRVLASRIGIDAENCTGVAIRRCTIRLLDKEGGDVGIFAQGEHVVIEGCDIQVIPAGTLPPPPDDDDPDTPPVDPSDPCADANLFYTNVIYLVYYVNVIWGLGFLFDLFKLKNPYVALGGIQIGSGSEDVLVRENSVVGGAGNGITLGSDVGDIQPEEEPEEEPEEDEGDIRFRHENKTIRGTVFFEDDPIGGMNLFFDAGGGQIITIPVGSNGEFGGELPEGDYRVYVSDTKFRVAEMEFIDADVYRVHLAERVRDDEDERANVRDLLAFIYDTVIEGNTLANMGLSGIGVPRFETSDIAASNSFTSTFKLVADRQSLLLVYLLTGTVTGFVIDLTIYRNQIVRCLQNVNFPAAPNFIVERGIGGISLALCDGLTINENTIEDCGRSAEIPVCGIFVSFGVDVTISDNHILNNGQDTRVRDRRLGLVELNRASDFTTDTSAGSTSSIGGASPASRYTIHNTTMNRNAYTKYRANEAAGSFTTNVPTLDLRQGPRGGIIVPFCLSANAFAGGARTKSTQGDQDAVRAVTTATKGRHAARIDGNYVVQPFGRALFICGAGSMSITDNQFISDRALPRDLDAASGGISGFLASQLRIGALDFFASNVMVINIGVGSYIVGLMGSDSQRAVFSREVPPSFPDGNVLLISNQMRQAFAGERTTSVSVITLDDVNMSDNQVDVLNGDAILSTGVVFALSARAMNNRFKEPLGPLFANRFNTGADAVGGINATSVARYSLVNMAFYMGNMIGNQGHYCFKLFGSTTTPAVFGNQSIIGSPDICGPEVEDMPPLLMLVGLALVRASLSLLAGLTGSD